MPKVYLVNSPTTKFKYPFVYTGMLGNSVKKLQLILIGLNTHQFENDSWLAGP